MTKHTGRKWMKQAKEHVEKEGFYEIPTYPFLYINRKGIAWDDYFGIYVRPTYNRSDYPELKPEGGIKPITVHRALALTFIDCPGDPSKYQVDHIDGNKSNFSLNNLRWVTRSENVRAAIATRLRTDAFPVLLRDLRTDEVRRFTSLTECSRFIGIHPGYLSIYLKRPQFIPFRQFYEVVREGDPWPGFTKEDIGKHDQSRARSLVAIAESGDKTIFGSTSRASEVTKVSQSQIRKAVLTNGELSIKGYRFWYLEDYVGSLKGVPKVEAKYADHLERVRKPTKPVPISVLNELTGEHRELESIEALANELDLDKKTVQKSVALHGRYRHFLVSYRPRIKPTLPSADPNTNR